MAITVTGLTVHTQTGAGTWNDQGTGGGSGLSTAQFFSSTSSRGRKFTGVKGMLFEVNAAGTDLSNSIIVIRYLLNGGFGSTISAGGGILRMEDTSGNQSDFYIAGSDTYTGGWQVVVIDTSLTESANSGTAATMTAIQYVGLVVDAASASGGDDNFYIGEVLSMPNTGLTLAGNTTNVFDEAATNDEASLYGIITKDGEVISSLCPLILSPDASDHISTDEIVQLKEPIYHDGTDVESALSLQGLSSADSDTITLTRLSIICENNSDIVGTNADKELDFASATDIVADTCTFRGFDGTTMALGGSGNDYTNCTFQGCSQITDTGAVVRGGFVRNTAASATEASLLWTSSSDWENTVFEMGSTNSHALEVETGFTDSWTGFEFVGYSTSAGPTSVGDEVLISNSTTDNTINASDVVGTISFRENNTGNVTINNNVNGTFDTLRDNTEIRIYTAGTSTELDGIENATAGSVDNRNFTASIAASTSVDYVIHNEDYETIRVEGFTWPSSTFTLPQQQRFDRNKIG